MATRRGRGIDFNHRFATSRWAEDLLIAALNQEGMGLCVRLGLSRTSETGTPNEDDTYVKEPDLLVFNPESLTPEEYGWLRRTDLTALRASEIERSPAMMKIIRKACAAIEVEFSPYRAAEMAGRNWKPRTKAQLARRIFKHANPPTAPNIWVKLEDLPRLQRWQDRFGVPIVVVHLFDQEGFAITLRTIADFERGFPAEVQDQRELQLASGIFRKVQAYDRVDAQGAGERKTVFVVTPAAATKVGEITGVEVSAQWGLSQSRKYVAHILFQGGELSLSPEFLSYLRALHN